MDAHIQIRNLNVNYSDNQALKDINLDIPKQQITVIMGPSGCGKTTLLKCFNRFLELADHTRLSGQVLVDGEDIYTPTVDVTEIRKKIGLLAQRPYPLPMSIYDNVAYGLRIHGICKKGCDLDNAVKHYLEIAGLWDEVKDRLHRPATGLSIGQQQRLCLARGLAVEPEILLGDEPTSALDPISAQNILTFCGKPSAWPIMWFLCIWARWSNAVRPTRFSGIRNKSARGLTWRDSSNPRYNRGMNKNIWFFVMVWACLALAACPLRATAQAETRQVVVLTAHGALTPSMVEYLQRRAGDPSTQHAGRQCYLDDAHAPDDSRQYDAGGGICCAARRNGWQRGYRYHSRRTCRGHGAGNDDWRGQPGGSPGSGPESD
jgi:phosphate transport system ATP-binding protein